MINKINKLSKSEFVKVFANIFENARWIAEELYNQKPFNNFRKRISSDPEIEFNEAVKQVKQIAIFRLKDLNNKGF